MLRCDICGGELEMQGGGKAVCASCGMKYSTESLREKFKGLKVSVTGSNEDVQQWRTLLQTYLDNCDFSAAEMVVKKMLEAVPSDSEALETYNNLQEWKHFDVRNGVLVGYNGASEVLDIPKGVKAIQNGLFYYFASHKVPSFHRIVFPEGCAVIGNQAFEGCMSITSISLPKGVRIEGRAFCKTGLTELLIPEEATVEAGAFFECRSLIRVFLQEDKCWSQISEEAFISCNQLTSVTTTSLDYDDVGRYVLTTPREANPERPKDPYNTRVYIKSLDGKRRESPEKVAEREQKLQESLQKAKQSGEWMQKGLCRYCGGEIKGFFTKTCSNCGKPKNY